MPTRFSTGLELLILKSFDDLLKGIFGYQLIAIYCFTFKMKNVDHWIKLCALFCSIHALSVKSSSDVIDLKARSIYLFILGHLPNLQKTVDREVFYFFIMNRRRPAGVTQCIFSCNLSRNFWKKVSVASYTKHITRNFEFVNTLLIKLISFIRISNLNRNGTVEITSFSEQLDQESQKNFQTTNIN